MLITNKFILIHMPKTGGLFLRFLCHEHLPADWQVHEVGGLHAGRNRIPREYAHLPAIAFVRNPWDWYVSWYHFSVEFYGSREEPKGDTHQWATLFGRGAHDFGETVTRACTRAAGDHPWEILMRAWDVDLMTAVYALKTGHHPPGASFPPGLASRIPDHRPRVEVGRFEHLREDFLAFLERHELPVPAEFVESVKASPPHHASRRGAYADYYDARLRDLVARKARYVISKHGYVFDPLTSGQRVPAA